jgi:hypothetical protein
MSSSSVSDSSELKVGDYIILWWYTDPSRLFPGKIIGFDNNEIYVSNKNENMHLISFLRQFAVKVESSN